MGEKSSTGKAEVNQTLLNTDDYIFPSRERECAKKCRRKIFICLGLKLIPKYNGCLGVFFSWDINNVSIKYVAYIKAVQKIHYIAYFWDI